MIMLRAVNRVLAVFNTSSIRVVTLEGNPWFVLSDVCKILGLTNPSMVAKTLDDDQKGINIIDTPYGSTKFLCVSESGLYSLILRAESKGKPAVKQFKDYVTKEVLPSIRKTGSFVTATQ